jgi:hypothetical protein
MTSLAFVRKDSSGITKILVFGFSIFLSAFLIFSVQPIFTKVVLPTLGGTPAVWSVAMVVFQGLLLAGYLYAHLLIRFLPLRAAIGVHIAVTCVAFLILPFAVTPDWGEPPQNGEEIWLIGTFIKAIGLPFFALAANAPLLQAWLAASDRRINVYHFYAASNIGSFAALFAYPFVIEPFVNLPQQSIGWSIGFAAFIVMLVLCATFAWRGEVERHKSDAVQPTSWGLRMRWLILAAVPSGLLIAATASIQLDVSGGPILWLLPLAIFLLTFVFAFRDGHENSKLWFRMVRASAIFALVIGVKEVHHFAVILGTALLAVLSVSMACHRALYQSRPASGELTEFYLFVSCGGFVGGLFAALVAPNVFSWTAEYQLLILMAALVVSFNGITGKDDVRKFGLGVLLLVAVVGLAAAMHPNGRFALNIAMLITAVTLFALFLKEIRPVVQGIIMAALFAIVILPYGSDVQRSFFSVLKVKDLSDSSYRILLHGSTIHGAQRISDDYRPEPLTYFTSEGAIGRSLTAIRETRPNGPLSIGVVGLGIGSMACHSRGNEQWTFFEIDPLVVRIAKDSERFRYLSDCGRSMPIIMGDARLTVKKQPAQAYDYLLLDAFSSDAIPSHLITKEAVDMFASRVTNEGILAFNTTNRYIDVSPILAKIGEAKGLDVYALYTKEPVERMLEMRTSVAVTAFAMGPASAAALERAGFKKLTPRPSQELWTDHYTNVTAEIIRGKISRMFSP